MEFYFDMHNNGEEKNNVNNKGEYEYFGYATDEYAFKKGNKPFEKTALASVSFRFYVGSKSNHSQRPLKGYKLLGLYYIVGFKFSESGPYMKIHGRGICNKSALIQKEKPELIKKWIFLLSLDFPSNEQIRRMRKIAKKCKQ